MKNSNSVDYSNNIPLINPSDEDFGIMLNCAVRYSLGRMTYMPHTVISFITPLLPYIDDYTLIIMIRDIGSSYSYGDEQIDKPAWMKFLQDCKNEKQRRNLE